MSIEEIINNTVGLASLTTIQKFKISEVIRTVSSPQQQKIDQLERELKIETKFKEAYLEHWQNSKEQNQNLEKEIEHLKERNKSLEKMIDNQCI
jgi:predicted RNase H-like nuclease (RuvC/YqgF family)